MHEVTKCYHVGFGYPAGCTLDFLGFLISVRVKMDTLQRIKRAGGRQRI